MSKRKETAKRLLTLLLITTMSVLVFGSLWAAERPKEIYVNHEAKTASYIARNYVTVQRYLPAIIQWHMESQVKIDNGYFEKGTLDYGCSETGLKIKHMECPVTDIGYTLTYSSQGKVMHFEWDYSKDET